VEAANSVDLMPPRRLGDVVARGSRSLVHAFGRNLAVEHQGESLPLIAKVSPSFEGTAGDRVGLQIAGTTHLFGEDGSRITSPAATLRSPGAVSRS
jgi:hypothetical protein